MKFEAVGNEISDELLKGLPDVEETKRFFNQLLERHPHIARKLTKNKALFSDILTLASFSPFLATFILQNPSYIDWLSKQRKSVRTRDKDELLESLARFSLTNSELPLPELLSKFRQRELLRIYLHDIRELGTIAEITEEISSLADAILEYALKIAVQEMDNRYGIPLEIDEKGKARRSTICIVALGKLGSKELNYASDIDLMFLYSNNGSTSGIGTKGAITNREYFVKLAELVTNLVSGHFTKSGAYRIDLRLRPYGKVGATAISVQEAINYYKSVSKLWEKQVLIRTRACAGQADVFRKFYENVEELVFPKEIDVREALENIRLSKEKINLLQKNSKVFNVKLGRGGIREIEFIAQALQIAYGGKDRWLRHPHTLIALSRLADRNLISESEFGQLSDAYTFLRRLEHRLQMEHGLQTHVVPEESEKRLLIARRMNFDSIGEFESQLQLHTENVSRIFKKIFEEGVITNKSDFKTIVNPGKKSTVICSASIETVRTQLPPHIVSSIDGFIPEEKLESLRLFCSRSPYFTEILATSSELIKHLPNQDDPIPSGENYEKILHDAVREEETFSVKLAKLRRVWARLYLEIAAFDIFGKISSSDAKRLQTKLADASVSVALKIAEETLAEQDSKMMIFGLGKLGGKGMDYGSDLDLVLIFDDVPSKQNQYSKISEIFIKTLSNFTREGNLYKVDLRLRPYGNSGSVCLPKHAFLNYLKINSAIWEWIAYIKLRAITSNFVENAKLTEKETKKIIYENANKVSTEALRKETRRIRSLLEQQKTQNSKGFNIKFSSGGKLDVYFAIRFLQLRDQIPEPEENRSTLTMLKILYENGSLRKTDFAALYNGYEFLCELDHILRLVTGSSSNLPTRWNDEILKLALDRLKLQSKDELEQRILSHRIAIRQAFENILS